MEETKQLDLAMIDECEMGEMNEPQMIESFEEFEEFEEAFGNFEPEFVGLPPGFDDRLLSHLRTKVSIPLSDVTEKIQLRHEIESAIKEFLDEKSNFSKKQYDRIIDYLIRTIQRYSEV